MNKESLVELKSRLDRELRLTLKAMDESPVIQKITMMTPAEIESLPEPERVALQSEVLQAIENAKRKATGLKPKYVRFESDGLSESGKTKRWKVVTMYDEPVCLGRIKWFGPWRCYSFFEGDLVFEKRCLRDIADFCEEQTRLQKRK